MAYRILNLDTPRIQSQLNALDQESRREFEECRELIQANPYGGRTRALWPNPARRSISGNSTGVKVLYKVIEPIKALELIGVYPESKTQKVLKKLDFWPRV